MQVLLLSDPVDVGSLLRDLTISSTSGRLWDVLVTSNITNAQMLPIRMLEGLQALLLGSVINRTTPVMPLLKISPRHLNGPYLLYPLPSVLIIYRTKRFVFYSLFTFNSQPLAAVVIVSTYA